MKNPKTRAILLLIISSFLILTTAGSVVYGCSLQERGEFFSGWGYFTMFTTDSNVVAGFIAVFTFAFALCRLCGWQGEIPKWAVVLMLSGSTAVMLTFITVVVFLGPVFALSMGMNFFYMFSNEVFFLHFANPVAAAFALIFLVQPHRLTAKDCLVGVIPTFLYSLVYASNVIAGSWKDFYNFTLGGHLEWTPIILAVMYGGSYLIAFVLAKCHNKVQKNLEAAAQ